MPTQRDPSRALTDLVDPLFTDPKTGDQIEMVETQDGKLALTHRTNNGILLSVIVLTKVAEEILYAKLQKRYVKRIIGPIQTAIAEARQPAPEPIAKTQEYIFTFVQENGTCTEVTALTQKGAARRFLAWFKTNRKPNPKVVEIRQRVAGGKDAVVFTLSEKSTTQPTQKPSSPTSK